MPHAGHIGAVSVALLHVCNKRRKCRNIFSNAAFIWADGPKSKSLEDQGGATAGANMACPLDSEFAEPRPGSRVWQPRRACAIRPWASPGFSARQRRKRKRNLL